MIAIIALGLTLTAKPRHKTTLTPPANPPATHTATHTEDPQLYQNPIFGFRYQIPYGWVDRTQQMQEGSETGKAEVLLATFERPPEATGDTINSAVVIASESTAAYPVLTKAED